MNSNLNLPELNIQGKGQTLVWMHGMLNSVESDSVYSLVDFNLLSKIVSVVRYNACNKSGNGDYSWPGLTNELICLADLHNFPSMILGGTSMGSGTAIHAAVRFPDRVKALILVTPPPAWEIRKKTQAVYIKIANKANSDKLPEILKRIIKLNEDPPQFFEEMYPGTRKKLLQSRLGFEPAYYSSIYMGGALSDFPSHEQIRQIKVPTLIVSYPADEKHPVEIARQLNALIPDSELVLISNSDEYQRLQITIHDFICSFNK